MKKFLSYLIIMSLFISMLPAPVFATEGQAPEQIEQNDIALNIDNEVENDYLVGYKNENGKTKAAGKGKLTHQFKHNNIVAIKLTETAKNELVQDPDIEYIEPDAKVELLSTEETSWGFDAIEAGTVHEQVYFGEGIDIAVLDTGVNTTQPDLAIAQGTSFVGESYEDDNGHGTGVIGIINAQINDIGIKGISPKSSIYPVKVLDQNGVGSYSTVIAGIEWAVDNGIDIINMSFGGIEESKSLEKAVHMAANKGILLIAAAGNLGQDGVDNVLYPAKYSTVIAVGSIDQSGSISAFTSNGPEVELYAPGEGILTTGLNEGYNSVSGTSFAAAHVAGTAAILMQANPKLSSNEIINILSEASAPINEGSVNVINAKSSLEMALESTLENTADSNLDSDIVEIPIDSQEKPKINNQPQNATETQEVFFGGRTGNPETIVDSVYRNNPYYVALKKAGRVDLFDKLKQEDIDVISEKVKQKMNQLEKDYKEKKSGSKSVVDQVYKDQSIPATSKDNKSNNTILDDNLLEVVAQTIGEVSLFNTVIGPETINGENEEKYATWSDVMETVSPETGDMTIKLTDIKLPGRNGLDLTISRVFQSNQAVFGDRRVMPDGSAYDDYSTYLINRYALGTGWSFGFPSVQIEDYNGTVNKYYHTGTGAVYRINITPDPDDSNLENYKLKDAVFNLDNGSFTNADGISSSYVFETADKTKRYFASDGRLIGIKDRFNNTITFEHTEARVSNRAPGNDFDFWANGEWRPGGWSLGSNVSFINETGGGKDDYTSMKFENTGSALNSSSYSNFIEVLPNTKYTVSGYIYTQLTNGDSSLTYDEYSVSQGFISNGTLSNSDPNYGTWEALSQTFTTGSNTRYIRIKFYNQNAVGTSRLDKVRFDRAWPLISKITDSIGRQVYFTYTDPLYEEDPSDGGTVVIKVYNPDNNDPPINPPDYTITYTRSYWNYYYDWRTWIERRRYPYLSSVFNGEYYQSFHLKSGLIEKFSPWFKVENEYSGWDTRPMIKEMWLRNSRIVYSYEKTTKHMGEEGFYDTHRISQRYEQYKKDGVWQGSENKRTYTYAGDYNGTVYDNETGYPGAYTLPNNSVFKFTSTMQQDNGLKIDQEFTGTSTVGLRKSKEIKYNASGDKDTKYYDAYSAQFPDQATQVRSERFSVSPSGTTTLYLGFSYNDWGGLASETKALTLDQWNDQNVKNLYTTSYAYNSTYKFLTSKTYYQDSDTQLTGTTNYDSEGRISSTVNAKGETTDYYYDDTSHPGNLTRTVLNHPDGRTTTTQFDYTSESYYAFPTSIINYYTEDGIQKTSNTTMSYEYLWGNVLSSEDDLGNVTTYQYDDQGRIEKVTYPSSTGENGEYVIEENYNYTSHTSDPQLDRDVFKVEIYSTKTPIGGTASIFKQSENYYDDRGNLRLSKYLDFDRQQWVTLQRELNDYGQLEWVKDAKGTQTDYFFDEWGRIITVTDSQGNQYQFDYDTYNRTKTTTFVPITTGIAENDYVETFDHWGRTISRKGFPDGTGGAAVEEQYEYDLVGNITELTDANNKVTLFQYDALNNLKKVTNALGEEVDYDYDRLGNLKEVKQYDDAQTFTTTNQYDERGSLISKQSPSGNPVTYKYNSIGLPVEVTDASGKVTTMQHDNNGRLSEISAIQDTVTYYYNPLGGVEKYEVYNQTTGNGEDLTYDYYSTGLIKQRKNSTYPVDFEYDLNGNRTKITDPFGLAVDYNYNNLNRLDTVTADVYGDNKVFTYEYYDDGMIKAVNYPNSFRAEYTYDNINRLETLINKNGTQVVSEYSYDYDDNGNITSVTANSQTTTYQYDVLNRLEGISRPNGETIKYSYDTRGNRSQEAGDPIDPESFILGEFDYNSWDELKSFTVSGYTYNYEYDSEGLRTKKTDASNTTRYHYDDNGLVIAETDALDQVKAQIIWGHKPLARKVNGDYYYYLYNGHGDVVQVVNDAGNIVNSYTYDEWGNILSQSEQIENPMRYAGEYYDEESGLYYLRARYYDPTTGRFISQDPYEGVITNPLSLNRYTYTGNNPVNYIDPTGLWEIYVSGRNVIFVYENEHDVEYFGAGNQEIAEYYKDDPNVNFVQGYRSDDDDDYVSQVVPTSNDQSIRLAMIGNFGEVFNNWWEWRLEQTPSFELNEYGGLILSDKELQKGLNVLPFGSVKIVDGAGKVLKIIFRNPQTGRFIKMPWKEYRNFQTSTKDLRGDALFDKMLREKYEILKESSEAADLFDAINSVLKQMLQK